MTISTELLEIAADIVASEFSFSGREVKERAKSSSCGANAQGGGGFQPGNTCGKRDGKGSESSEGGGKGASVNPKILEWAREKFGDDTTAENFAKWFGDSKVVDAEGNPLVVYHGTRRSSGGKIGQGGFAVNSVGVVSAFFDMDAERADGYAVSFDESFNERKDGVIIPAFLAIKNPKVFKSEYNFELDAKSIKKAKDEGYDGYSASGRVFLPFSPTQIKSATGNSGTFDPKDPNITKSGSDCGANGPGGGGFQPGNTCGREDGAGEPQGEAGKAKPQGAFAKAREAAKADLERIRSEVIKTAEEWAAKIEEAKKVADAEFDKIAGATEPMEKAWKNMKGKTGEEKAEALRLYEAEAAKFDLLRGPANEAQARYRKMQEEARIAVAAVIGKESLALSESLGITDKHEQSVEENSRLHYSLLGVVAEEAKVLKDPSAMKSVTSGRAREARIAATEFLDSMLHPAIHQSALHSEIVYMEHGERASARPVRRGWNEAKQSEDDNKTGFSSIPLDATSSTYIHEYGHQVEFGSQEIRDLTLDFLASRTQGEEIVSLKEKYPDTNYDEWERGAKDGFAKAHEAAGFAPEDAESKAYYAGKSYGTRLTELLPMGLELMHKDAAAFAKADPEWFDLVAGIATGRLLPIAQKRLKDGK